MNSDHKDTDDDRAQDDVRNIARDLSDFVEENQSVISSETQAFRGMMRTVLLLSGLAFVAAAFVLFFSWQREGTTSAKVHAELVVLQEQVASLASAFEQEREALRSRNENLSGRIQRLEGLHSRNENLSERIQRLERLHKDDRRLRGTGLPQTSDASVPGEEAVYELAGVSVRARRTNTGDP